MSDKIAFELVSPTKKLIDKQVTLVTVPGSEGDFGVLPGHAPMIATVRPGVIEVYENEQISERIFVAGGFAEITDKRCTVLAAEAMPVSELSREGLEEQGKKLEDAMGNAASMAEQEALGEKLAVFQAKLAAVS
ncbi:MAG: ATP synthase F1 subunit epsilon [Alphaproteobacteria bacterium]